MGPRSGGRDYPEGATDATVNRASRWERKLGPQGTACGTTTQRQKHCSWLLYKQVLGLFYLSSVVVIFQFI